MNRVITLTVCIVFSAMASPWAQSSLESLFEGGEGAPSDTSGFFSSTSSRGMAAWTFMVYIAADNNLSRYALGDIEEMEQVGSSEEVNIVALVDRATGDPGWSTARIALIRHAPESGAQSLNESGSFEDVGELNTGDPETLYKFIKVASEACPARRYALILWSHGSGWRSTQTSRGGNRGGIGHLPPTPGMRYVCSDWNSDQHIYMRQVREALEKAGISFELVAFDACLMGMVEVAYEIKDRANYIIASEQSIEGTGFNYAPFLKSLSVNPDMDGQALGIEMIKAYDQQYGSGGDNTLAMVVPARLPTLVDGLNTLVRQIAAEGKRLDTNRSGLPLRPPLETVRDKAGPDMGGRNNPYIDLGQFLEATSQEDALPQAVRNAAGAALQLYHDTVPVGMRAQEKRRTGLAIFLPKDLSDEEEEAFSVGSYTAENILFAKDCLWPHFVLAFAANKPMPELGGGRPGASDVTGLDQLFE